MTDSTDGDIRALGRTLVDEFGRGWSKAKVDVMMGVFSPDPVFQEGPFSEPFRGADAVHGYWGDVPLHQSEITFTSGEIFTIGPWFATEFKCTFRRRRTGEWVDARGAMFCETADGKITEMRLYWDRR